MKIKDIEIVFEFVLFYLIKVNFIFENLLEKDREWGCKLIVLY